MGNDVSGIETTEKVMRMGRRPGDSTTREAILAAAKKRFAADGFAATTIRRIASEAGVDPSLIMQYYQSKAVLFAASLAVSAEALKCLADAFEGPLAGLGVRVTRAFLTLFEQDGGDAEALMAMQRTAISSDIAATQLRDFLQYRLVEVISPKLHGLADAPGRAALAASMLVGLIVGRCILRIPVLVNEEQELVIQLVGPSIQTMLTP